jgi:mono/diheme cytochrome c family protein/plastocyanin
MNEKFARILTVILLLGGLTAIGISWWVGQENAVTLHARMPEAGGWSTANLTVAAGHPLHLRLTSDDVMHGFAIGQSDQPAVDIKTGMMVDYTVTFDKPGTYTFYCTRWCGPNHWRMRGTITVTGEGVEEPATPPLYVRLGLDIDAKHEAQTIPVEKPSVQRGADLALDLSFYQSQDYIRSHSPEQVWQDLRNDPEMLSFSDQQLWDAVAFIWQSNNAPEALKEARQLYAENCAACHGESGGGDGVFSGEQIQVQNEAGSPTDFTDPKLTLSASPALLQGKLIRGGMGTGMPMWGVIFTEDQTWALVNYLYTFQFEEVQ